MGRLNCISQRSNLFVLTSPVFDGVSEPEGISTEAVQLFMLNNLSLESLVLWCIDFRGDPKGPPAHLLNLKSLRLFLVGEGLSTIICVPAFRCLSLLQISPDEDDTHTLDATGDGITFSAQGFKEDLAGTWEPFAGYARPTICHIRLEGGLEEFNCLDCNIQFVSTFLDAHTLEIWGDYWPLSYDVVLDGLKQLGPQLKVIRFAISDAEMKYEECEECEERGEHEECEECEERKKSEVHGLLDQIEDLVKYRFQQGQPFSAVERSLVKYRFQPGQPFSRVERLLVCGSGPANEQQDGRWRRFYDKRGLGQYVLPVV